MLEAAPPEGQIRPERHRVHDPSATGVREDASLVPASASSIPTFTSDGAYIGRYTAQRVERLLSLDRIVVHKNYRGRVKFAQFRTPGSGGDPRRQSALQHTRYSRLERVGETTRTWSLLTDFLGHDEESELFVLALFRAVPLSCFPPPPPAAAKRQKKAGVIPIDHLPPSERKAA